MATETKINDIASQLSTASRLVVSTDFFWVYTASGLQVKIPAEFAKAYLVNGVKPSINANGNWEIDGKDLGVVAKGKTPQFRGGTMGIEVSYDEGKTWTQAVAYTDMDPDLTVLAEAYTKVTQGESTRVSNENARKQSESDRQAAEKTRASSESTRVSNENTRKNQESARVSSENTRNSNENTRKSNETSRQNAESKRAAAETTRNGNETTRNNNENTRKSNETGRVNAEANRVKAENSRVEAEKARVAAETKRETDFSASKKACDDATAKANSTYSHPPYVDKDGYYYKWNVTTSSYNKTDVNLTGKAFQIKKVFASVAAMNATDVNTFAENDFILINTANVEDADNAKLYVVALNGSGKKFYSYLVDMSGFRGFTGKTPQFLIGNVTTLAENANATASVSASGTDTNGNPVYKLNLGIPKGIRLRFADLTDSDKAELMKPATDAAAASKTQTAACKTATDNANAATTKANTAATNADKATSAANTATTKANTAATNADKATEASKTQTTLAKELNDNPLKQGDNGNWWKYNPTTQVYEDTGIAAIGGILYPSFSNHRNHLYLIDYQQYVSNRVSYNRNHLRIKI